MNYDKETELRIANAIINDLIEVLLDQIEEEKREVEYYKTTNQLDMQRLLSEERYMTLLRLAVKYYDFSIPSDYKNDRLSAIIDSAILS